MNCSYRGEEREFGGGGVGFTQEKVQKSKRCRRFGAQFSHMNGLEPLVFN